MLQKIFAAKSICPPPKKNVWKQINFVKKINMPRTEKKSKKLSTHMFWPFLLLLFAHTE